MYILGEEQGRKKNKNLNFDESNAHQMRSKLKTNVRSSFETQNLF